MIYRPISLLSIIYSLISLLLLPFSSLFNGEVYNNTDLAREKNFAEYVTKAHNAALNFYLSEKATGNELKECYAVESEIGLSNPGDFKGYVCIIENKSDYSANVYISLTDGSYSTFTKVGNKTYNYINYSESGEPFAPSDGTYDDNIGYVIPAKYNFTNKLEVVNGKPVNDYEI